MPRPPPSLSLCLVFAFAFATGVGAKAKATGGTAALVPPAAPVPGPSRPRPEWTVTLEQDDVVEGVRLPSGTVLHFEEGDAPAPLRGPDGKPAPFYGPPDPVLKRAVPSVELFAWGLPVAAGEDLFLGSFVSLVLAAEATVEGLPLEAGTIVEFERRRGPGEDLPQAIKVLRGCTLSRAATVQGVQLPGSTAVEFLPDGLLWRARLFDDDDIGGLPVDSSADAEFHPNGHLASFRLSRDTDVDGHSCLGGDDVRLHASGRLAGCSLAAGQSVQGLQPDTDHPTSFFETGLLEAVVLVAPASVDGLTLQAGAMLQFHPNARIRRVQSGYAVDPAHKREKRLITQVVRGIPLEANLGKEDNGAFFRADGSLEKVVTRVDFEYEGIPVAGGFDPIEFWVSGRIKSARLARDFTFKGHTYARGTQIRLRRDGSLASN